IIYFSAPNGVFAIDGVTGKQVWKFNGTESEDDPAGTAVRGPAYWPGTSSAGPRIYSSTGKGLAAIDAKTGKLVPTFGEKGMLPGMRANSPPVIYKDLLITKGPRESTKGVTVKAFDVVTGEPRWTFYVKAQPGDPNRDKTWLKGSADTDASPGIWGMF